MTRIKFIIILCSLFLGITAIAQTSKTGSLRIGTSNVDNTNNNLRHIQLPKFEVIGNVSFVEPSSLMKNGEIDAGETCKIMMKVRNIGEATASGLIATIVATGNRKGLSLNSMKVEDIPVGKERIIEFPIVAGIDLEEGSVDLGVSLAEPHGMGTETFQMNIKTRAFRAPMVAVTNYAAISNQSSILRKTEPFDFQVVVGNIEKGPAEDVSIDIKFPENVLFVGGTNKLEHLSLRPGEEKDLACQLVVSQAYSSNKVPITISLNEKYGKYAKSETVTLTLKQEMNKKIVVTPYTMPENVKSSSRQLSSDVDRNIPETDTPNPNTYVLIIANSQYQDEPHISTALNDGETMWKYCRQTLGVPEENITLKINQTLGQMRIDVKSFAKTMDMWPDARFLVFYFGHGMTDKPTGKTYMLPVDGTSEHLEECCYLRDEMLSLFGQYKTRGTLIFMESCFTGATADGDMLSYSKGSSGAKIAPGDASISEGNIVLFSASSGTQTASAYEKEQHNLFTYCLLKNLQESKGDISLGELFDRAREETRQTAHKVLGREQEPSVISAPEVGDTWKNWTLK